MSEEILVPCAKCGDDVGVILGIGTRDELGNVRCWRCDAGLPRLPKPEPSTPPPLVPHHCPLARVNLYKSAWRCGACGRLLSNEDIGAQLDRIKASASDAQAASC